jgi:hypothetical protein
MSHLLRDAIVDAKALREAALKNAEASVIDRYSEEVRSTLNALLEQEEEAPLDLGADLGAPDTGAPPMDLGAPDEGALEEGEAEEVAENIPLAATDGLSENEGEGLSRLPRSGEDVEVDINLDALQEAVQQLQGEQEINLNEADLAALLEDADPLGAQESGEMSTDPDTEKEGGAQGEADAAEEAAESTEFEASGEGGVGPTTKESLDISDELIDSIVERLTVDMGADLTGWAGSSTEAMRYQMEKEFARRRSTDVEDNMKDLKKAQEEVVFENKRLKDSLTQYKQATQQLKESLHDVNLSNARLLYTNRVLRNTSLNERQKTKIADAISKAGSVTEAKTIYRTLESTVESTPKRGPQSLSEAIGRQRTSVIRASRQESTPSDPIADRMKKLAGID